MKLLPIALAALAGLGAGILAGRTLVPSATEGVAAFLTTTPASSDGSTTGGCPDPSATGKSATESPSKDEPLTFSTLLSELTQMEAGNLTGAAALRARADLLERLKHSDLPTLVSAIAGAPPADRDRSLHLVFSAYAEESPQAAWNLALSLHNPFMRRSALHAVMSTIAPSNPEQALAMAEGVKDAALRRQMRGTALSTLAGKDPARAFNLALQSEDKPDYGIASIIAQWMRKDPQAAMAAAAGLKGRQGDSAQMVIISELTRTDPQTAWDYAARLPAASNERYWSDPRLLMIHEWAQFDPAAALGAALTIQEAERREMVVASAINTWASSDFPAALDYAIKIPDAGARGRVLQNLAHNSQADHSRMFEVIMEHAPSGDSFQNAMSNLLNSWAQENPQAAAAAVMQLSPGRSLTHIAGNIAGELVSNGADKREVLNWARNLPEGETRNRTVNSLFGAWAREDSAAALQALFSLGPDEKSNALQGIANGWSRSAPADAVTWAASLPSGSDRDNAMRTTITMWANSSPAAAANFVGRLPEAERAGIMGIMVGQWASRDAASAAAWLQRQPAGKPKDEGLKELAQKIAEEDPETAISWANSISDTEARTSQTERIARNWLRHDPVAARKWISTSHLPADVRQKLLQ